MLLRLGLHVAKIAVVARTHLAFPRRTLVCVALYAVINIAFVVDWAVPLKTCPCQIPRQASKSVSHPPLRLPKIQG